MGALAAVAVVKFLMLTRLVFGSGHPRIQRVTSQRPDLPETSHREVRNRPTIPLVVGIMSWRRFRVQMKNEKKEE